MSTDQSDFFTSQSERSPTSPTSPGSVWSAPETPCDVPLVEPRVPPVEAWEDDKSGSCPGSSAVAPPAAPAAPAALATSAVQFMERRRKAQELETSQQTEWQHFIRKRNSSHEDSDDECPGPMVRMASRAAPAQPLSIAELYRLCNEVSKTLLVPIAEVKACFDDFVSLDLDGSFTLSADEFEKAVRRSCRLMDSESLPENLALKYPQMDSDGNKVVDFKEYVRWCQGASWSEQLLVRDDRDREARRLARVYGIHLLDVERLRRLFDSYATHSRVITQDRFSQVIRGILKVSDPSDVPQSRLERYWREIDLDGNGTVDFEEFVIWMNDRGPQQSSFLTRGD